MSYSAGLGSPWFIVSRPRPTPSPPGEIPIDLGIRNATERRERTGGEQGAGRDELADKESAEAGIIEAYLPAQLTDEELSAIVDAEIAGMTSSSGEAVGMKQMGLVIKAVKAKAGARADGSRVAAAVKAALA